MTKENIEVKAVEAVAETAKDVTEVAVNKEAITSILTRGTDHKFAIMVGAAVGTGLAYYGLSVLKKKTKKAFAKKDEQEEEAHMSDSDIQDALDAAGEALREHDGE